MCVHLRQVKSNDDIFLYDLYASTRSDELDAWGWDERQRKSFLEMQFNAQRQSYHLQYPHADHHIIMRENQPIGRLLTQRTEQEIRLIDISLLTHHRNAGIGSTLIKELLREATNLQLPLRLSVLKTNPARKLYERLGFVVMADMGMHIEMEVNPD